jgi:hypothetical protein
LEQGYEPAFAFINMFAVWGSLSLPLTAGGQEMNSSLARRMILNGPSFQKALRFERAPLQSAKIY